MRKINLGWVSGLCLVFALVASTASASHRPDLVLYGGKVFTVDPDRPWAEAVAVRGARIVAVGSTPAIRGLAGPGTRQIDLGGRLVVPGFNDAHVHLGVGLPRLTLPPIAIPGPGPTLAQALEQVEGALPLAAPGEWILVIVGEAVILDPAADRTAIDAVATANPVLLMTWSSHSAVANSAALAAAGIGDTDPDPFGGEYGRFPSGVLDGRLHEYALFRLFRAVRDEVPDEVLRAQFEALTLASAQAGVTSLQEMTIGLTRERSARILAGADLAVRVRSMCVPMALAEPCPPGPFDLRDRLTWSGIKWLLGGTPVERSAALSEPYADAPGTGRFNVSPGELSTLVRRSLHGLPVASQLLAHAVGDRAVGNFLRALELSAPPVVWRLLRPRIEHGDLVDLEDLDRVRLLGVVVVQNPIHLTLELEPALGPVRTAAAQPLATWLAEGVRLGLGSDGSVPNPFLDLFLATLHPFHPDEALTMEQAVTAYTRGSAAAEFQEWQKGSLKPGYLADLTVLSQDLFTAPSPAIPGTTSVLTLVGGEVVWDAGVLGP